MQCMQYALYVWRRSGSTAQGRRDLQALAGELPRGMVRQWADGARRAIFWLGAFFLLIIGKYVEYLCDGCVGERVTIRSFPQVRDGPEPPTGRCFDRGHIDSQVQLVTFCIDHWSHPLTAHHSYTSSSALAY